MEDTKISKIAEYMDNIFVEEYNPKFISKAIIVYDNGDYEETYPQKAIDMIDNFEESVLNGILCINFQFDYKKINLVVEKEYKKLIENII